MNSDKFSIIIVPSSGGKPLQFLISRILLYIVVVSLLTFLAVNAFFTYGFFSKSYHTSAIVNLTEENEFLNSRVGYFATEIEKLKNEYVYMASKEREIRAIFNLPEIDPQERALGIGGPLFLPEEMPSQSRQVSYDTESRLDELVRLSSFEIEQYDTIYNTLIKRKNALDHMPSIMPTSGYITRGFGIRHDPFTGSKRMHAGIDVANREGTPIYASADGKVENIKNMGQLGKTLILDHGNGIKTYYGHILKATVRKGQMVERGDKIAEMGNTGRSTAPHLHYGVKINNRFVNPMDYIFNRNWLANSN